MNANAQKVWDVAESWVGKNYAPGVQAQCANFVRHVYSQAGVPVGCATDPDGPPETTVPGYADSFASDEVGKLVSLADSLPGDIVMYANTYGGWPAGTITHVGIISKTGGGLQIDRSTSDHPVYERSPHTFDDVAEVRRPWSLIDGGASGGSGGAAGGGTSAATKLVKLFAHDGKADLVVAGQDVSLKGVTLNGEKVTAAELEAAGIHTLIAEYK